MKKIFLVGLVILFCRFNYSQVVESGNITLKMNGIISSIPAGNGTNEYQTPSEEQLKTWEQVVLNAFLENYPLAHQLAESIGYKLIQYTDISSVPNKLYYILQKREDSLNYWGTFVFDPVPLRHRIVVQSPHPLDDINTGKQGFMIFKNLGARAFFISGAHRCNSIDSTDCSGVTSACGIPNTRFRKSDHPHIIDGTFQKATEVLSNNIFGLIVIQVHGFDMLAGDPDLVLSNGTPIAPEVDYLVLLKENLYNIDTSLTFKIAHINTDWNRLTATTNTQGRLINEVANPCVQFATYNAGRFIHIEQAYAKLRDTEENQLKLYTALSQTFPENPVLVELSVFSAKEEEGKILLQWRTESENNILRYEIQRYNYFHLQTWETIGTVMAGGISNSNKNYFFYDELPLPGISSYRLKQINNNGSTDYSNAVDIELKKNFAFVLYNNYPNPFNPVTNIRFAIPSKGKVLLEVFNLLGERVCRLINEEREAGIYRETFNAEKLPGGYYIYRLYFNNNIKTGKMMLIK